MKEKEREQETNLVVYTPFVTIKQFHLITGMSVRSIRRRIEAGELLTKKAEGEKGLVLINMEAWRAQAIAQMETVNAKSKISR